MKIIRLSLLVSSVAMMILVSCTGRSNSQQDIQEADTAALATDTIKRFMSNNRLVSEVTFRDGKRHGLTKTFYPSGRLQRTYWYDKGLRQDSSCWYYEEGQLFRTTPFRNDTVEGIQKQYYRTGQIKAKMGYTRGYRNTLFQEFTREGKLVTGYPDIVVRAEDSYNRTGVYRVVLELTDKTTDVKFFRGEFTDGVYDTTKVKKIRMKDNTGYLDLKKTGSPKKQYVGVIGEVLTGYGNRALVYKKIDLPYNDLE